jgi:hypothetical protein
VRMSGVIQWVSAGYQGLNFQGLVQASERQARLAMGNPALGGSVGICTLYHTSAGFSLFLSKLISQVGPSPELQLGLETVWGGGFCDCKTLAS